jgi:hypothetical protein
MYDSLNCRDLASVKVAVDNSHVGNPNSQFLRYSHSIVPGGLDVTS